MDPTFDLCEIYNSINGKNLKKDLTFFGFITDNINFEISSPIFEIGSYYIKPITINYDLHNKIGKSIFYNSNAVILANLNFLTEILDHVESPINHNIDFDNNIQINAGLWGPQNMARAKPYPICLHFGSKNIGFAEFIQFKYPLCFNYIATSENNNDIINQLQKLDSRRTNIILNKHINDINEHLKSIEGIFHNIDIIFLEDEPTDINLFNMFFLISKWLKLGGSLIFKINASDIRYKQYLNSIAHLFKEILMIKPFSTNLMDPYIYIICKKFNNNKLAIEYFLSIRNSYLIEFNTNATYGRSVIVKSFINNIPELSVYIDNFIHNIILLRNKVSSSSFFPPRSLLYWGLPGTPENIKL